MKKFVLLIATAVFLLADADAFDVKLLANNKEAFSRELSKNDIKDVERWISHHRLGDGLKLSSERALRDTFNVMERIDTTCELGLISQLQQDGLRHGVMSDKSEILDFIAYLRHVDMIDDILYRMMKDSANLAIDFVENANDRLPGRPFNLNTRQNAGMDLKKFYAPVQRWPDDVRNCTLDTYWEMVSKLEWKNGKDRDSQMQKLNYIAVKDGHISMEVFNKMETMRKNGALDWPVYFKRYADIINNAKDRLTKNPEKKTTNDFTVEYVSRRDGLTQRGNLYQTYNSTQVMMLAQIIEKTAKRMDAKQASIHWEYGGDVDETEIYVLSPMEQYRAAIRMLRKDMAEVMRSDSFRTKGLQYEHLIAAAYEAGYIRSEELDYVLRFEELWNPKTPKWKAYANFAFSLAGTAAFYLPPPWNIIGAIGLVLTQSKLVNGDEKPDPDDNWNVII